MTVPSPDNWMAPKGRASSSSADKCERSSMGSPAALAIQERQMPCDNGDWRLPRFNSASHQAQITGTADSLAVIGFENSTNLTRAIIEANSRKPRRQSRFVGVATFEGVKFLFQAAQNFIVDFVLVAEVQQRGALQSANAAGEFEVKLIFLRGVSGIGVARAGQQIYVVLLDADQFVIDRRNFGRVGIAAGFQIGESGVDHGVAGALFFRIFDGRAGETEFANEEGQS